MVIPAYNEAASVASVVRSVHDRAPECDIVVVNDGSSDATGDVCRATGMCTVLELKRNLGIGGAVQTGYKYALRNGYGAAVQVDGDGQHPADQIPRLLGPLNEGQADMVIGSRFAGDHSSYRSTRARQAGIALLAVISRLLSGVWVADITSGFRACNRQALRILAEEYPVDYPEPESVLLLARHGLRVSEVPVAMSARTHGRSSIRGLTSLYYVAKVLLALAVRATQTAHRLSP